MLLECLMFLVSWMALQGTLTLMSLRDRLRYPQIAGLLTVHDITEIPLHYESLMSDQRWAHLEEVFWDDFHNIFQLPKQSAFSACLQSGTVALQINLISQVFAS